MLLVLDNAEPVRRLTAWIDRLLAAAPALKVLATSRRRLGASGEWLLPLEGLAVPPTDAQPFAGYDAVRLFELRARAAHPPFDLPAQAASVARLVRRLGGLPLAIELAAPWVRLLPVHEIELEVASSLDILAQEQDGDERPEHRSVRATFEQSWRLLAPAEQRAFAALSVFVGSFSRLAAKDVAAAPLALLNALADKSLIRVDSEGRIGLHPLLVQFGRDKLRAQGDDAAFAAAHREWYARWLAQRRDALQNGQREALDEVQRELANCLVAWRGLIVAHDSERIAGCAAALMYFLERRQRFDEGAALLKEAADRLGADREGDRLAAAEVLRALGQLHYRCGRTEAAVAESRRALRLFKAIKQREGIKRCLGVLGLALWQSGAYVEAKRCFDDALRRARADGDAPGVATFVGNVGLIEQALGNDDRALALFGEALQRNQDVGDLVGVGNQYINLGNLHRARHEVQQARRWYEEGRAFAERHGHLRALPWFSINLLTSAVLSHLHPVCHR
jgi:predicted ATPase